MTTPAPAGSAVPVASTTSKSSWRQSYVVQLCGLVLINFSQGLMLTAPFTLAVYMVRHFEEQQLAAQQQSGASEGGAGAAPQVSEQVVGRLTGLLAASFSIACFFVAILWGVLSNIIGRKMVIVIGSGTSAISMLWFGLAGNYASAFAARFVGGIFNGVLGAWKTMVGEMNDGDTLTQGKTFSYMSIAWGVGTTVGPLLGGGLADPCKHHPTLHGCGRHGLLRHRPFVLPCLVCAMLMAAATALCATLLLETLPEALRLQELGRVRRRWRRLRRWARAARARLAAACCCCCGGGGGGAGGGGKADGGDAPQQREEEEDEEEGDREEGDRRALLPRGQQGRSDDAAAAAAHVAPDAVVLEMAPAPRRWSGGDSGGVPGGIHSAVSEPCPGGGGGGGDAAQRRGDGGGTPAGQLGGGSEPGREAAPGGGSVLRSSISATEERGPPAQGLPATLAQPSDQADPVLERQSLKAQQLHRDLLAATLFDGRGPGDAGGGDSGQAAGQGRRRGGAGEEEEEDDDDLERQRSQAFGRAGAASPSPARSPAVRFAPDGLPPPPRSSSASPSPRAGGRRPGDADADADVPWRLSPSDDGRDATAPRSPSPATAIAVTAAAAATDSNAAEPSKRRSGAPAASPPRPLPPLLERSGSSAVLRRSGPSLSRTDSVRVRMAALMRAGSRVFFLREPPAPFLPHQPSGGGSGGGAPAAAGERPWLLPSEESGALLPPTAAAPSSSSASLAPPPKAGLACGGGKAAAGGREGEEEGEGEGAALLAAARAGGKRDSAAEDEEEGKAASGGGAAAAAAQRRPWYTDVNTRLAIASYGLTAMLFAGIDELLPIFASAPIPSGGLGLEPSQLALPLAVFGVALILYSAVGYPYLQRKMGTRPLALWGLAASVVTCIMLPLTHTALAASGRTLSQVVLYASMIVKCFAACSAFTGSLIMVNAAPPREDLGEVNGVGQTVAALVRGAGPALAGVFWAASVAIHGAGSQFVPFIIISTFAMASAGVCYAVHLPNLK